MVFSTFGSVEAVDSVLRSALAGQIESQENLIRQFAVYTRSCARKFFLSDADRQDLLQEGRIALFRACRRYRPARGPFAPYARLVIRRHMNRAASKMIQRNAVECAHDFPESLGSPDLRDARSPENLVMEDESRREFARNMSKNLTHLESDVLSLFLQGMSYREMARRLKRPAKSVDNALRRIRAKVKA